MVYLQPFEMFEKKLLKKLQSDLSQSINADIKVVPDKKFPLGSYYEPRNRYWADSLLSFLQLQSNDTSIYLGVTSKDISTTKGNIFNYGVMGLGLMPGKACIISTYRLGDAEKLNQRFCKLALHELGHNSGLPHCKENGCYMLDAEGRMKLDSEFFFCSKCYEFLKKKSFLE